MKYLGGCEELCKRFDLTADNCCTSCHEDANEGYCDLCDVEVPEGYYNVCCRVYEEYRKEHGEED